MMAIGQLCMRGWIRPTVDSGKENVERKIEGEGEKVRLRNRGRKGEKRGRVCLD